MVFARSMWGLAALVLVGVAGACELRPRSAGPQSPGDNHYRLLINGDVERYAPEQRYVVTLVGSRTHSVVQQFTRFQLTLEPLAPGTARSRRQGRFELFADTLTKFHEECTNSVVEADDLPKTEVQVMWKAPPAGSGCVLLKAMVYENASRWFAEDGQLTRRVCEDTSLDVTDCCACDDAKYRMVFEGLWSEHTHPKDYPKEAQWLTHFSDVIGATHPKNFSFWGEGEIATDGFRSLAEWGSVGLLERELQQRRGLRSIVKAQGLWYPKVNTNTTAAFTVDRKRHLLSLASMFGPSPDWVVGVSGLSLCARDCSWVPHKVIDLYPYDAGTDNGISYMSPNSETIPREKMYRITTMYPEDPRAPFYNPGGEIAPMARLYLTREKIIPRSCDEEVLQALVTEEAENTQSTNKPECAVSEWGAWSACSVTCGKGLRMRTREYRMPQKAQMFACDRQLVSKEMCVAAVPECEGDGANEADSEPGVPDGACAVSEWGPWSECSVTCGVGMATRRRQFLDRMGPKKCPLVQIEENQKCMQPACTEEEGAGEGVSDPTCPTTAWSSWSACSASCGRGVAFRTRLLLVPAASQADCAARVELLQHRPCTERDSCEIDMLTAKRICMEVPEQGPCRGVYQRWAFVAMKGMCVPFTYGGCRGNQNNFISQDDCTKTCSVLLANDLDLLASRRQARRVRNLPLLNRGDDYVRQYRLSEDMIEELQEELSNLVSTRTRGSLSIRLKLLCTLAFLATGSYQRIIGRNIGTFMSQPSISRSIDEIVRLLSQPSIVRKYIRFPQNSAERTRLKEKFYEKFGIPGVIGCIDGTFVAIIRPRQNEDRFYCRKGFHARNVLLITDADLNILHVDSSFGGASHDSHIFNNSPIKSHLEQLIHSGETAYLLGDSGYLQRPYLMIPIANAEDNSPEEHYNKLHATARNSVERAIGVLKGRFRCLLAHRVLHYSPDVAARIITACCVLHNMCNRAGMPAPVLSIEEARREISMQEREQVADSLLQDLNMGRAARNDLVNVLWRGRR